MPDRVTLDVIDRPAGGMLAVMRHARGARACADEALRALLVLGTGNFVVRLRPAPTPRRVALLAVWDDGADIEARWTAALGGLAAGARESWHVEAELVRAAFTGPWRDWTPDVTGARPLDLSEPALMIIAGDLHARHVPAFMRDVPGAVAHALAQPGYLGGLAIINSPVNTTSVSCWRTYQDARDYAFGPGGHADAMRRDRAAERHRTEWFIRLRPLLERGSLAGTAPLAPVLAQPAAPTA
ncbi:MAG: hypothetical protein ACLGI5_12525 [Thermoleophilia bacterium]